MLKLAAVQAAPVFLNLAATTKKAADLIRQAGKQGADVIGFPEAFIPGYPGWNPFLADTDPIKSSLYLQLFNSAVVVPGPEVEALQTACREANINAVIGINERHANSTGTLYNTQLIIGRDGTLLHKHEKIVPTVGERLIHAPGTTGSKVAAQTGFGGLSGLICGENLNPLAQYATSLDYPVVHVASWPSFLTFDKELSTLMSIAGKAVSTSVGTYVIASASIVNDDEIEMYAKNQELRDYLKREQKRRRAMIFGPGGVVVAQSSEETNEEIVYAEVDPEAVKAFKHVFDWAGHYNRPELFASLFKERSAA
ncbi:carbon-nitrogen hydrolase [Dendryphion nanum]|uniref:Carbon-nitrogen hydrolase n=1 Tax=Dendryphion nanum TaxID=256645 RepID=A0A9P9DLC0_9PLEO|nr:carbon-nitrogen hydrolase [Dendryphion nanum]